MHIYEQHHFSDFILLYEITVRLIVICKSVAEGVKIFETVHTLYNKKFSCHRKIATSRDEY